MEECLWAILVGAVNCSGAQRLHFGAYFEAHFEALDVFEQWLENVKHKCTRSETAKPEAGRSCTPCMQVRHEA